VLRDVKTTYNYYFLVPYLLWLVAGCVLLCFFNKQDLFAFVNTHHTTFSDVLMYYISWMGEGVTITIILLLLLGISSLRNWWYFLLALLSNVLPTIATQIIKHRVNAPRPLKYFDKAPWVHIDPNWPQLMEQSFPSGHSTGAFSMFCILSLLLPEGHKKWGILFFCMALLVAYSRMYLAAHFFADIYTGSFVGGVGALLIYAILKPYRERLSPKQNQ
jgi:membrane-associated phospholipid phosphatase